MSLNPGERDTQAHIMKSQKRPEFNRVHTIQAPQTCRICSELVCCFSSCCSLGFSPVCLLLFLSFFCLFFSLFLCFCVFLILLYPLLSLPSAAPCLRCPATAGSQSERDQSGAGGQHPAGERCSEDKPSRSRTGNNM